MDNPPKEVNKHAAYVASRAKWHESKLEIVEPPGCGMPPIYRRASEDKHPEIVQIVEPLIPAIEVESENFLKLLVESVKVSR